jgi:hypothetical protein
MRCPHCRREFRVEGRFCPHCGRQLFGLTHPGPGDPPPVAPAPPEQLEPETYDFRAPGTVSAGASRRGVPPDLAMPPDTIELEAMPEIPVRPAMPGAGAAPAAEATQAGSDVEGKMCPYDRYAITAGESVVICPHCQVAHHADCWRENGGCTTRGCQGAPVGGGRPVTAGPAPAYAPRPAAVPRPATAFPPPAVPPAARPQPWQAPVDAAVEDLERNATNGVVLSVVGLGCCPVLSIVGFVLGLTVLSALSSMRRPSAVAKSRATWAVVAGIVGPVLWALVLWGMGRGGSVDMVPPALPPGF